MGNVSDDLDRACDYCLHAKQKRNGDWFCSCHRDDYFPEAPWDGEDDYSPTSCDSFDPDRDCHEDEDWIW